MLSRIFVLSVMMLCLPLKGFSSFYDYIDNYKQIAVDEMNRTGIPASIKLAQALLESNQGKSSLAVNANNHFGIKCGRNWQGGTFYREDDDYKNGKLIESCFRSYQNAEESFRAHSNFLRDPKKSSRYGFLFKYDTNDFESWAYGLYDAGYATDPKYPEKLISIIKKYELNKLDQGGTIVYQEKQGNSSEVYASTNTSEYFNEPKSYVPINKGGQKFEGSSSKTSGDDVLRKTITNKPPVARKNKYRIKEINDRRVYIAKGGETVFKFAQSVGIDSEKIIEYNERVDNSATKLYEGELVYIQEKQKSYDGKQKTHKVKKGETMYEIAQKYGIKLTSLYAKNRLPKYAQAIEGETLSLKGKIKLNQRPRFIDGTKNNINESKFIF